MKCTSKICYEHFIEMPSLGVGLICHAMSLTHNLGKAFPDHTIYKNITI